MEAQTLANELGQVRDEIAQLEVKKSEIEEALLFQMKANGLKGVNTDYGEHITRVWKTTYKVLDKTLAFKWAEKNQATKTDIDTKRVNALLAIMVRDAKKLPKGFEKVESEYLRMLKANEEVAE